MLKVKKVKRWQARGPRTGGRRGRALTFLMAVFSLQALLLLFPWFSVIF